MADPEVRTRSRLRKVGHSVMATVPSAAVKRGRLHVGEEVELTIRKKPRRGFAALGLLKDRRFREFQRDEEHQDRDRF